MGALPPDLSRLGDELAAAAARALERRRRRLRALAGTGGLALVAVAAVLGAGVLGSSSRLSGESGPELSAVVVRPPERRPLPTVTVADEARRHLLPGLVLGHMERAE